MVKKISERQKGILARKFIKEQGLTTSFSRFRRLKSTRKQKLEIIRDKYDNTQKREHILVLKERGRTVFRDFRTYDKLASTKQNSNQAIKSLFGVKKGRVGVSSVRGWGVLNETKTSKLKLKNTETRTSYNEQRNLLRKVEMTNVAKRKMVGFAVVDVTMIGKSGNKKRVQARSKGNQSLYTRKGKDAAITNAISNASAVAGFSPIDVILHNFWFEYWTDTREKLRKVLT